jgi:sacsin
VFKFCESQGPALLAYNDATFTEEDWVGIRSMHESVKRKNPLKVGRFGLGFKSAFHMTGEQLSTYRYKV